MSRPSYVDAGCTVCPRPWPAHRRRNRERGRATEGEILGLNFSVREVGSTRRAPDITRSRLRMPLAASASPSTPRCAAPCRAAPGRTPSVARAPLLEPRRPLGRGAEEGAGGRLGAPCGRHCTAGRALGSPSERRGALGVPRRTPPLRPRARHKGHLGCPGRAWDRAARRRTRLGPREPTLSPSELVKGGRRAWATSSRGKTERPPAPDAAAGVTGAVRGCRRALREALFAAAGPESLKEEPGDPTPSTLPRLAPCLPKGVST